MWKLPCKQAENPQKYTERWTWSTPLSPLRCISKANAGQHLQWMKSLVQYYCSKCTASCFVLPVFVDRVKQYQYHYKFSGLIEGLTKSFHLFLLPRWQQNYFLPIRNNLEERKVLHQFQSHFDCSVFARKFSELYLVTFGDQTLFNYTILREGQPLVRA